jgi:hypothetical protein
MSGSAPQVQPVAERPTSPWDRPELFLNRGQRGAVWRSFVVLGLLGRCDTRRTRRVKNARSEIAQGQAFLNIDIEIRHGLPGARMSDVASIIEPPRDELFLDLFLNQLEPHFSASRAISEIFNLFL